LSVNILHIETSTKVCSVVLSSDRNVLSIKESLDAEYSHAEKLNVFIEQALKEAKKELKDLSAISVSKGPGSFTGLRIGVSSAKGFAFGLNIPLISCDTLDCMASAFLAKNKVEKKDMIIPMIDARRREVYMKIKDSSMNTIAEIEAKVIDKNTFDPYIEQGHSIILIGDGAGKFKDDFKNESNVKVYEDFYTSANHMVESAHSAFEQESFEDIAYFEPFYLKEFIAIKPRKIF